MRRALLVAVLLVACGESAPPPSSSTSDSTSTSTSTSPPTSTSTSDSPSTATAPSDSPSTGSSSAPSPSADPATCDRVRPCIEAFAAVAPEALAAPARTALEQLDQSLGESPARAAACRAAVDSYRRDLEQAGLEVPEACR